MHLKEIVDFRAGELIRGITIPSPHTYLLNKQGWKIFGKPSVVDPDDTCAIVGLGYYRDTWITGIKNSLIMADNFAKITSENLHHNTECLFSVLNAVPSYTQVREGEIIGMSLGESVLCYSGSYITFSEPTAKLLYCFHRVLFKEKTCWLVLKSNVPILLPRGLGSSPDKSFFLKPEQLLMELC